MKAATPKKAIRVSIEKVGKEIIVTRIINTIKNKKNTIDAFLSKLSCSSIIKCKSNPIESAILEPYMGRISLRSYFLKSCGRSQLSSKVFLD